MWPVFRVDRIRYLKKSLLLDQMGEYSGQRNSADMGIIQFLQHQLLYEELLSSVLP